jgi:exodeoxyribonuclease I
MQFGGQRTDMELNPVGEPHDHLIKMTDDVVPEPDAILVTGITPQKTISEGISEAEFLKIFHNEIATPDTVFIGYNTVRFDDEFMRFLLYRNFYDAYEWQYKDGRSRWDLLDLVRMTRALRPEGIEWPFDSKGNPSNRLELLTSVNKIEHTGAHDALVDVRASIALARLIRSKQPKLFDFLFKMRDKKAVEQLVLSGQPFVYTSGKYDSAYEKTTVVGLLSEHPAQQGSSLVFDLRYDPTPFIKLNAAELTEAWRKRKDDPGPRLPVKTIKYNRCPAIAPLSVLDKSSQERLNLKPEIYEANYKKLKAVQSELSKKILAAVELMDKKQQARLLDDDIEADARLYDGFIENKEDKTAMSVVRAASLDELASLDLRFQDGRLQGLLPLYKARNYPKSLSDDERMLWEQFRIRKLTGGGVNSRLGKYFARIAELQERTDLPAQDKYLLEELELYGQSIMPTELE